MSETVGFNHAPSPSSFSISSLLGHHLSCNSLSSDCSITSFSHHSPQLVKKIRSGFSGKSVLVNAARMLAAPKSWSALDTQQRQDVVEWGEPLTFRNALCVWVRCVDLHCEASSKACIGDQSGRHCDNVALPRELTAPPVRREEVDEFCLAVGRRPHRARATFELGFEDT